MKHESYEALFEVGDQYIYVQTLDDDPEYDFDYTIYDGNFKDLDGGVIGKAGSAIAWGGDWDLRRAAEEVVGKDKKIVRLDLQEYCDFL